MYSSFQSKVNEMTWETVACDVSYTRTRKRDLAETEISEISTIYSFIGTKDFDETNPSNSGIVGKKISEFNQDERINGWVVDAEEEEGFDQTFN